ncbi:Aste57867_22324 [Aphanomyces stellatus]|uniref:Aste57867_22324 protein n=1 Tax=Aphanomyces stellatus TaxID=120398 RepID=A0A485LL54_9STRA|nr:hypothetical protein As57867_022254 [Aphanomyces stellatus]VFT98988.1 Aste57867_22324 [Aphanomyces stellatus]
MKSAFGMKSVKKENLEKGLADMKELGMGGLSKGLTFLRTASQSAMAPADEEKPPRASSFNGSSEKPKMSYDELLSLSMKLTKQNKAYKAQLTQASDKLFAAGELEANYASLVQFVADDVGMDLIYAENKVPPMTTDDDDNGSTDGDGASSVPVEKLLDASAMRQVYHTRDSAREQHVREMEDKYVHEISQLRAEVQRLLDQSTASSVDLINLDSPGRPAPAALRDDLDELQRTLEIERKAHASAVAAWQAKLEASEIQRVNVERTGAQVQSDLQLVQSRLATAEANAAAFAKDIESQMRAMQTKEESLAALKREMAQQQMLMLKLQDKSKEMGAMGQRVVALEQEIVAYEKETTALKTALAEKEAAQVHTDEVEKLREAAAVQASHLDAIQAQVAEAHAARESDRVALLAQVAQGQVLLEERQNHVDALQIQLSKVAVEWEANAAAANQAWQTQVEAKERAMDALEADVGKWKAEADAASVAKASDDAALAQLRASVATQSARVTELEVAVAHVQSERDGVQQQLHERQLMLDQRVEDLEALKTQLTAAQNAVAADANEKVVMLQEEVKAEQQKAESLTAAAHTKAQEVDALTQRVAATEAELAHARETAAKEREVAAALQQQDVQALKDAMEKHEAEAQALKQSKAVLESELDQLRAAVDATKQEVATLQDTVAAHEANVAAAQAALGEAVAAKAVVEANVARLLPLEHVVADVGRDVAAKEDELVRLRDQIRSLELEKATAEKVLTSGDAELALLRENVTSQGSRIQDLESRLAAAHTERDNERDSFMNQLRETEAQLAQSQTDLATLKAELAAAHESVRVYAADVETHAQALRAKEDHLATLQQDLTGQESLLNACAEKDGELARLSAQLQAVEQQAAGHVDEISRLQTQVESHQTDLVAVQETAASVAAAKAQLETELAEMNTLRALVSEKSSEVQHAHAQVQAHHNERAQWQSRVDESERAAAARQADLERVQAQLATAEATADAYAKDIQSQMVAIQQREENLVALKREMQNQAALLHRVQEKETEAAELQTRLMAAEQRAAKQHTELSKLGAEMDARVKEIEGLRQAADAARAAKANVDAELQETRVAASKAFETEVARWTAKYKEMEAAWNAQKGENARMNKEMATLHKTWSEKNALAARLHAENVQLAEASAGTAAELAQLRLTVADQSSQLGVLQDQVRSHAMTQDDAATEKGQLQVQLQEALSTASRNDEAAKLKLQAMEAAHAAARAALEEKFAADVERMEADGRAKSKLARQMVLEKEELIASLTDKLTKLEEDVRSGDADHRRIFELASMQANRDASARSREQELAELTVALEQMKMQNIQLTHDKHALEEDIAHLVRTERREGVNMEYLKNVVVQYMSFRPGSSQQQKLMPVLSMLLQFTPEDLEEVNSSSKHASSWTSWSERKPVRNINPPPPIVIPPRKKVGSPRSLNSPRASPRGSPRGKARRSLSPTKLQQPPQDQPLVHNDSIDL